MPILFCIDIGMAYTLGYQLVLIAVFAILSKPIIIQYLLAILFISTCRQACWGYIVYCLFVCSQIFL